MSIISKVKRFVANTDCFDRYALKKVRKEFPEVEVDLLFKERDRWIFKVGSAEYVIWPDSARLLSGDRPSDKEEEVFSYILDELYWKLID